MSSLPNTASKADELAYMEAFLGSLGDQTYLKNLLAGFSAYAQRQIADDMAIAPLEWAESLQRENWALQLQLQKCDEQLQKSQAAATRAEELRRLETDRLQQLLTQATTSQQDLQRALALVCTERDQAQQDIERLRERVAELEARQRPAQRRNRLPDDQL